MSPRRATILLALLLAGGCRKSLEVNGQQERVVGQTVTLALTEGEPVFSGEVWLESSDGTIYETRELKAAKKDERTLSFVIPSDVAVGPAHALPFADAGVYKVPLSLNRLALTLDDKGTLEGWPLPPGTIAKPTRSFAAGPALAAVTPGGGELVLATGGQLLFIELGSELKDATAGIKLPTAVTALAAVPGGALAVAESALSLVRFVKGGTTTQASVNIPGLRAVAASATGDRAFALSACDTNSDSLPDSDCVTEVVIGTALTAERRVVLDAIPSATVIGATGDGRGAVVGDTDVVHGVWFEGNPKITTVAWTLKGAPFSAQPVSIDHAATVVKSGDQVKKVDLFAVAEKAKNAIVFLAFNPVALNDLQRTSEAVLPEVPVAISYGRRTELYAAAARNLYSLDAGQVSPTAQKLAAQTTGTIQSFVVQP